MNFISAYVRISNNIINNSGELAEITSENLQDFQMRMYEGLSMNYPKFYKMDSQSKMGIIASELLFKKGSILQYKPEEVSIVLSNADASLDADLNYRNSMLKAPSPALFVYTLSNIVAGEICIRFGIKGENAFFVNRAFEATQLANYIDLLLMQKGTEACLAGWINVVGNDHDVLLYLVEKQRKGTALEHNAATLGNLYGS